MERRNFVRVEINLSGKVQLDSGACVPVQVRDLSHGGAQIQCDALDSEIIAPGANCLGPGGKPLELDLDCSPAGTLLKLRCRVVFVRRISHDAYRIGLRYADPLQTDLLTLKRLISHTLSSGPDH